MYGLDGELVAEYKQGYAPFVPSKEYGYSNGQLLITAANGDEQRVAHFVEQLFLRAAVAQTSTNNAPLHVNTLANAGAQGETQLRTAAQTVVRQIYQASTLPAADLVTALYLGVLQRYGDAGGISYWTSIAQSDRNAVIEAFVTSGEFYERVQVLYGREVNEYDRTDKLTHYLYNVIAGRGASAPERDARRAATDGANVLGQSSVVTNAKDFARSLFNGAEYAARNRTNSEFVYDLYLAFLRYAPDSGGWNYWTGVVNSNGRAGVLETFLNAGAFDVAAGALYREVLWLVADHLGTPRMIAERSGQPAGIKHHDYLPFGEELFNGISGRDAAHGYGSADSARQQFTAYERDDETGLDYAQARYYSSAMGRFTSVDPAHSSMIIEDPQSFNRFVYVSNNPLRFIDPNGLNPQNPWSGLSDDERRVLASKFTKVKDARNPTQNELDAAGTAFNTKVTSYNRDGSVDGDATSARVESVRNFVDSLSFDNAVWDQISSIDSVSPSNGGRQSDVGFTVMDRNNFINALTHTEDTHGYLRFVFLGNENGHTDSVRELGYGVTDPSMHIDSNGNTGFSAHWDPSTGLTKPTLKETVLDSVPGGLSRRLGAAAYHWVEGRAMIGAVQQSLNAQGLFGRRYMPVRPQR